MTRTGELIHAAHHDWVTTRQRQLPPMRSTPRTQAEYLRQARWLELEVLRADMREARRELSPDLAAKLTHLLEWLECAPDVEHGYRTLYIEVGVDASKRSTVQLVGNYRYEPTLLRDGDGESVADALGALEIPRAVRPRTLGYRGRT